MRPGNGAYPILTATIWPSSKDQFRNCFRGPSASGSGTGDGHVKPSKNGGVRIFSRSLVKSMAEARVANESDVDIADGAPASTPLFSPCPVRDRPPTLRANAAMDSYRPQRETEHWFSTESPVKIKFDPFPGLRCTTEMGRSGNSTLEFSRAICGSFQFFTVPRKISASSPPEKFSSGLPGRLSIGTIPTNTVGIVSAIFESRICSSVSRISPPPKSPIPAFTCRMLSDVPSGKYRTWT